MTPPPPPCPLCGAAAAQPHLVRHGYAIDRCGACGAVYVNPMPSDAALRAHYQQAEYFSGLAEQGYRDYADMRQALRPHFRRRLRVLGGRLAPGRLLDFGCAAGFFLEEARAAGWQIAGVELSADMAQRAAAALGVPIATSLAAADPGPFDAITLWEVVEHLPRPLEVLADLRARLRPGGVLMLSTPNTGHWQAQRAVDDWIAYRPPSHLQYFTRATLARALRQAGFEQIQVTGTMPLPELPRWAARLTAPLQAGLATGQPGRWALRLWTWRLVRAVGWAWQRLTRPGDDAAATLEAVAVRPR